MYTSKESKKPNVLNYGSNFAPPPLLEALRGGGKQFFWRFADILPPPLDLFLYTPLMSKGDHVSRGDQHPIGPTNPLKTIDFTVSGGGGAVFP